MCEHLDCDFYSKSDEKSYWDSLFASAEISCEIEIDEDFDLEKERLLDGYE